MWSTRLSRASLCRIFFFGGGVGDSMAISHLLYVDATTNFCDVDAS